MTEFAVSIASVFGRIRALLPKSRISLLPASSRLPSVKLSEFFIVVAPVKLKVEFSPTWKEFKSKVPPPDSNVPAVRSTVPPKPSHVVPLLTISFPVILSCAPILRTESLISSTPPVPTLPPPIMFSTPPPCTRLPPRVKAPIIWTLPLLEEILPPFSIVRVLPIERLLVAIFRVAPSAIVIALLMERSVTLLPRENAFSFKLRAVKYIAPSFDRVVSP